MKKDLYIYIYITFMAAKKLDCMYEMGMEGCSPPHSRSSDASFHITNRSCVSLELAAIDLRVVMEVMVAEVSGQLDRGKAHVIFHFKP